MNMDTLQQASPLLQAREALDHIRRRAHLGVRLPLPIIGLATIAMLVSNVYLFHNAFLSLFLGIIFVVFVAGQVVALTQLRRMKPVLESAEVTLRILEEAGNNPDLEGLQARLRAEAPPGEIRNLVLNWLELGVKGSREGYDTLLEEALDRRSINDGRMLSLHATINRTTLKLGFLGTLIGIILTFPPMKRAVLGLSDSDGELKFIRDIALAIDGDQYAILSTLVATGLSILVEFVTIQMLERLLLGFDVVNSNINDWNALTLQPAIDRRREVSQVAGEAEKNRDRLEQALVQAQLTLENHLAELMGAMRFAGAQMDQIGRIQLTAEERISRLEQYERQYRSFIAAKREASLPEEAAGEP
jgi:biopolymer transport protein ExbB/TolQ